MTKNTQDMPIPVVGLFILDTEDRVLLVKSPKWSTDWWAVPGGRIEHGETIRDAALREAKEEVGLDVVCEEIFQVQDAINPDAFFQTIHFIYLECRCRAKSTDLTLDQREITEAKWFEKNKLAHLDIEPHTKEALSILFR